MRINVKRTMELRIGRERLAVLDVAAGMFQDMQQLGGALVVFGLPAVPAPLLYDYWVERGYYLAREAKP